MLIHTFEPPGISELPKEFEDADHHLEICKTHNQVTNSKHLFLQTEILFVVVRINIRLDMRICR